MDDGKDNAGSRTLIRFLAGLAMIQPLPVDMYFPAGPAIVRCLQADPSALQDTVTDVFLGFDPEIIPFR